MRIIWYDTVDSTNAEALRRASVLEDMTVIAAREQTAGRGQRGNTWTSASGENLTFTVLLKYVSLPESGILVRLNMAVAVAVRNFLRSEGVDAVIKWPNDVYVGRRKICGMLIENRLAPTDSVSAVGIGINLNQTTFPASLPNPVSLRSLTGKYVSPEAALARFEEQFKTQYDRIAASDKTLKDDYEDGLFQKDIMRPYRDLRTGEVFEGVILGVSPADGRLLVERKAPAVPQNGLASALYGFKDIGYIL